jgi:hypothetical protein
MNQITIETNVVATEINEVQGIALKQAEETLAELNSAQLALVGGGSAIIIL